MLDSKFRTRTVLWPSWVTSLIRKRTPPGPYRAYSKLRSHTFEQSVYVTLDLTSTEKQSVCVKLDLTSTKKQSGCDVDLKFSKVCERRVCADLEFSMSICTTKTRGQPFFFWEMLTLFLTRKFASSTLRGGKHSKNLFFPSLF